MNITLIGTGYVGLVSGIMMSYLGHNVICLDKDRVKIDKLNKAILPIYEPHLDQYLTESLKQEKIKFTYDYDEASKNVDAVFVTVGTPSKLSGEANLEYVYTAIDEISRYLNKNCLLIIKSTVPPTSCDKIISYLAEKNIFSLVAANPEFLREGNAIEDFLNPDRIVIGVSNEESSKILKKIYAPLLKKNIPLLITNLVTAELIKYASNSFLATKIAYINEMANLCEKTGANIHDLSYGMGLDKRIGDKFLKTGPGFGGSCFPKDILALNKIVKDYEANCLILEAVINSNEKRPFDIVNKISFILGEDLQNKNIAILGLTYKAGTDDIRSSPAIMIIKILLSKGANIRASDPLGIIHANEHLEDKNLLYFDSTVEACNGADAVIIATEWPEFTKLNWEKIYTKVKLPIIIDLRNILNARLIKEIGFEYYNIGTKIR